MYVACKGQIIGSGMYRYTLVVLIYIVLVVFFNLRFVHHSGYIVNLTEKLSSVPEYKPGSPALRAGALTNWATQTSHWAKLSILLLDPH